MKKETKGITLIALIITIIVMLILLAVTISILVKSNIIGIAENAADKTKTAYEKESNLSDITINGKTYGKVEDYIAGKEKLEPTDPKYFSYTYNDETGTATITGIKEEYRENGYYKGKAYALYIKDGNNIITDLIIPSEINIDGIKYSITGIERRVFSDISYSSYRDGGNCSPEWTSIVIPGNIASIEYGTFMGCDKLTSVVIEDGVISIGRNAFYDCDRLTSIKISDTVKSIGQSAFESCGDLTNLTIGKSVTSIGAWAFSGCSSLTSIEIPDSVTSIGSSTFSGCSSLTSIEIPDSVTSIGSYVFHGCSSLTRIEIPDSVTSIEQEAFIYCSGLTDVYYTGSEDDWAKISISYGNDSLENATIHYNYNPETTE